jgi:hypothetical protein
MDVRSFDKKVRLDVAPWRWRKTKIQKVSFRVFREVGGRCKPTVKIILYVVCRKISDYWDLRI